MNKSYRRQFRRAAAAAFAAVIALSFPSCSKHGNANVTETDTEAPVTASTEFRHTGDPDLPVMASAYLKALPNRDFDGATFLITSPDTALYDPDGLNYLSDTVSARNRMVEDKYNITVSAVTAEAESMLDDAKAAALAGMYYSDVMSIPLGLVSSFASAGVLTNLRSLPALDLSKPYFNASSVSAMSAGYAVYGAAGEATPASQDLTAVFFNRDLMASLTDTSPYDEAANGSFTWDRFFEYAALCNTADGSIGAVSAGDTSNDAIYVSAGGSYVASHAGSTPTVAVTHESLTAPINISARIRESESTAGVTAETAAGVFAAGGALLTVGSIRDIDSYRSADVNIGVLPMPKADADSPIRSAVGASAQVMTVTAGATGGEFVGLVMSGLCAASYGYVTEKYVDYLHVTVLPDNRSADMLDIISKSAVYDFAAVFGDISEAVKDGTVGIVRKAMDSGSDEQLDAFVYEAQTALNNAYPCDR